MRVLAILPRVVMIVALCADATVRADGPGDDEGAATDRKGPPSADAIFSRIDRDDDGKISQEEFEAAFKRLRRMRPRWSEAPRGKESHHQSDRDRPRQRAGRRDDWRKGPHHGPPHRGLDRGRRHGNCCCCCCGRGGDRDDAYRHERGYYEGRGPRGDRPRFSGPPRDIERMQDRGPGRHFEAMFDRFDEDNDGSLSEDEVPEGPWARISRADKDGDGQVSKDELESARKLRKKNRPGDAAGPAEKPDPSDASDDDDGNDDDAS